MFVGISAGRRGALLSKVPLTKDASGRIFQRALKELGLSESDEFSEAPKLKDCYVTNLVKGRCLTPEGNNRLPVLKEIEFWWPRFLEELSTVKPDRILALGDLVADTLGRKLSLDQLRRVSKVKHPRFYASQGALSHQLTKAFLDMTFAYRLAIGVTA
jgi:uracil-DNA glycosylase family 4